MSVEAVFVGGVMVDNIVTADGSLFRDQLGGNAVHAAAGARLWLDRVGIVGLIPSNYPLEWLDRLRAAGLALDGIRTVEETVTCMEWLIYAGDGSRADHLYAEPGALDHLDLHQPRLSAATLAALRGALHGRGATGGSFGAFRHAHPISLADVPTPFLSAAGLHLAANRPDQQCAMARALCGGSRRVTLDPGSNAAAVAQHLATTPVQIDAILPSERELRLMEPGLPAKDALARLIGRGALAAVVKRGANGALVQASASRPAVHVPALPVVARDPTGAGDAFCGGFLAGLIETSDPLLAACCGTVSASFAVEGPGPFHLIGADRAEARRRLELTLAALPPAMRPHHSPSPSSPPS